MKTYTYSYQNGLCRGREAGEVPGQIRRRPQTPPRPRKVSNKLFQGIRGLGKCQTSCFKVSDASERLKQVVSRNPRPRKGSNKLFQGFRRVGKAQTSCFKVSDASGRLRTAPAGAGKPAGYPKGPECTYPCRGGRLRTPANLAGYPKGPECTTRVGAGVCGRRQILPGTRRDPNACTRVGAYCIRPTKHPARDE